MRPALMRWARLVDAAAAGFARADPEWWQRSHAPGKWRHPEVIGHLIDSAAHNHLRLARALAAAGKHVEAGYDQEALVASQGYARMPPEVLAGLWLAYNRLLLAMALRLSPDQLDLPCRFAIEDGRDSVGLLLADYVEHLEEHLRQLWPGVPRASDR